MAVVLVPILYSVLRTLIMSLITAGVITAIQEAVDGTLKTIVNAIKDEEGLTLDEAKDVVANILVDLAVNTATIFVVIKGKWGVKVAEYLGFTTKGYVKRKLTQKAAPVAAKLAVSGVTVLTKGIVKKALIFLGTVTGLFWMVNMLGQLIEPGIYKPEQTNAVYARLGIPFRYPVPEQQLQPGPFDNKQFLDFAKAIEAAGVVGINNDCAAMSMNYSRQGLADLINCVYGQRIMEAENPSAKQLIPFLSEKLVFQKGEIKTAGIVSTAEMKAATIPTIKVFSGIVSQGKLGEPGAFVARETDLIDDVAELQEAAQNNLASFIVALPGRIVYEIKIVASITTKDGFRISGTTQRIITGYTKTGRPKYKTITNKFAQLNVYVFTGKNVRTKIDTINLGPVNSATFTPTNEQIQVAEREIKSNITTTDIKEIEKIIVPETTQVETIKTKSKADEWNEALGKIGYSQLYKQPSQWTIVTEGGVVREVKNGEMLVGMGFDFVVVPDDYNFRTPTSGGEIQASVVLSNLQRVLTPEIVVAPTREETIVAGLTPSNNPNKCGATTISEFFDVERKKYPSVQERAELYDRWGLGPKSYYVGTAEQNNKWLTEAKRRSGC